jgi:mRNA interferase MazF
MMRGKIVLLPFPFDDFSATKVRPALCLTDEIGPHGHVVVAFISSKLPALPEEFDLVMHQADTEFLITGLRVDSVLKVNRMMTVTHSLILREMGTLSGEYLRGVQERLRTLFRV